MQSPYQDRELLIDWVQAEINYLVQIGQLANNRFLLNNCMYWSDLISNGFVLKLFQSVDPTGFSKLLSFDAINHHESSFQHILQFYWNGINTFMVQNYNKEINPVYLKKQTTFKRSVYNQSEEESCESSTMQLVKLLFYLLVQKENIAQKQYEMLNNNEGVRINETKEIVGLNDDSGVIEGEYIELSEQNCEEEVENELMIKSEFLGRICQLSSDVQQYLVSVIQQIQQQQLIRPLTPLSKTINQSLHCISSPQSPTNNSNFRRIIFKQIQHLQQENDHLRIKIDQIIEQNNKLEFQIQQNASQQNKMINQINDYNQQKEQLFTYLRIQNGVTISTLDQFIELVRHVQHENQSLETAIAQIQERNYQLEKSNALKLHSINKSAVQITHLNQQIHTFKTKIRDLKQDIQYLDQIVNSDQQDDPYDTSFNTEFNAQMIRSINVDDEAEMLFRKSVESELRHSVGNVLKENLNISNQKIINQIGEDLSEKKSISKYSNIKMSIQDWQKSIREKSNSHYRLFLENQQNIQPSPFDEEDYIKSDTQNLSLKSSQLLEKSQQQEDQKEIEFQKQKYRQQLVNNLQQLYKEISDLSAEIAQIKQSNKEYQKKNKFNDKKIAQLKALHEEFLREFCVQQ